jgi:hypothetical protein
MSVTALQQEIDQLNKAHAELFQEHQRREFPSLEELITGLRELRAISSQIEAKEALMESLRPLAEWEKELLGI